MTVWSRKTLFAACCFLATTQATAQQSDQQPSALEELNAIIALETIGDACGHTDAVGEAVARTLLHFKKTNYIQNGAAGIEQHISQVQTNLRQLGVCSVAEVRSALELGARLVEPIKDGYVSAVLDYGRCPSAVLTTDIRMYGLNHVNYMTDERKKAATSYYNNLTANLPHICTGPDDYQSHGVVHTLGAAASREIRDSGGQLQLNCDPYDTSKRNPFMCNYSWSPVLGMSINGEKYEARLAIRAAIAKAKALDIDARLSCGEFSLSQRAVGEAQMRIDAAGLSDFAPSEAPDDPEAGFNTVEEVIEAGRNRASAMVCDNLKEDYPEPFHKDTRSAWDKRESSSPKAGVERIKLMHETIMVAALSLDQCETLENLDQIKTQAQSFWAELDQFERRNMIKHANPLARLLNGDACVVGQEPDWWATSPIVALDRQLGEGK